MFRYTCAIILIFSQLESYLLQVLPPPIVELSHGGSLLGTYVHSVRGRVIDSFLGIRYAKPPLGPLRFADPVPVPTWSHVRKAKNKPEPCFQYDTSSPDKTPFGKEDCLFLNVFTPRDRTPNEGLPVMVWLHHGAYYLGSSDPDLYGPERLLDHDVILVTLNYRLGALGFLSTQTSHSPGNYGLKDQLLALKWVRDYISDFGGNPDDVTLFGQSIGAACASFHMVSPASKGLFHKAILQSGNYFDTWAMNRASEAVRLAKRLAEYVRCPKPIGKDYSETMSCLREAPAEEIVLALEKFFIFPTLDPVTIFRAVVEPKGPNAFLDTDPHDIENSHGDEMPIIIGVTSGEGLSRSAAIIYQFSDEFKEKFDKIVPKMLFYDNKSRTAQKKITRKIKNHYFSGGFEWSRRNHQNLTKMFSDRFLFSGMEQYLRKRLLTRNKYPGDTYVYVFDHNGPKSSSELYGGGPKYYGVCHGDELQFLFPYGQLGFKDQKRDRQMQWSLPKLWTDFAKSSNPTPSGTIFTQKWKRARSYPFQHVRIGTQYRIKKRSFPIKNNSNAIRPISDPKARSILSGDNEPFDTIYETPSLVEITSSDSAMGLENVRHTQEVFDLTYEEVFDVTYEEDLDAGLQYHSRGFSMLHDNSTAAANNKTPTNVRSNADSCSVYTMRETCPMLDNKREKFWDVFLY